MAFESEGLTWPWIIKVVYTNSSLYWANLDTKQHQIQLSWQSIMVQIRIILGKSNQNGWPILINVVKKCEVQQDIKLRYMLPVSTFAHIQNTEEKIFDNRKQEINKTFLWMWKDDEAKLGQIKEHFWNLGCGTSKKIMSTRKLNHLMSDLDVITIFKKVTIGA